VNTDEALVKLGGTTADVVAGVLASLCGDDVGKGQASVVRSGTSPLDSIAYPAIATDVAYTDGVTGGNLFTITRLGARRLAAAMTFQEPPTEDSEEDLDELELSALGEAMNQMMAASAGALSAALGYAVEISVPTTRVLASAEEAAGVYPQTPHATGVSFTMLGESCRLIQLIPNAFVVRMAHALDNMSSLQESPSAEAYSDPRISSMLREIPVRVTAELGRATVSLEQLSEPGQGLVIELDSASDAPIDLCVNGHRFATGQLFLIDQTEWAMRIEHLLDVNRAVLASQTGGI
jgi:flagellar motor switch protein FliN/FliY